MYKKTAIMSTLIAALALSGFTSGVDSGIRVGDEVTSFNPHHVTGPNKGTDACPPCTYGHKPMVQAWVNGPDKDAITEIAKTLDAAMAANKSSQLKTFVIVLVDKAQVNETKKTLEDIAEKNALDKVGLAYLEKSDEAVTDYKVNVAPEVKSTIFVYKDLTVKSKFVNLKTDKEGLGELNAAIGKMLGA
jgi:hypothetical protein